MPLTTCPDCSREVSERAAACPGCGAPMQSIAPSPALPNPAPVLIEQTDKKWKGLQVYGYLSGFIGLLLLISSEKGLGALALLVGLVMVIFARYSAWWTNG